MTATIAAVPREVTFGVDDVIVSKTDLKGRLTYVNRTFADISGFDRADLIGQPHNVIRHPDMPGAIFKLLWDTISAGDELFAYVKNATRSGGHYWVLAHVTASRDRTGHIVGYHSNRRCPDRAAVAAIEPIYAWLRELESRHSTKVAAAQAGLAALHTRLAASGLDYERFVWALIHGERVALTHG